MPYFNTQRNMWMAQIVVNGHKHRSQHPTKAAAVQWEVDRKRELEQAPPPPASVTLLELSRQYLDHSRRFSVKTLDEKKLAFRKLFESVAQDLPAADLRKGDALAHFARQAQARSGHAANKDRKNLAAAWSWAAEHLPDFPARNPFLTSRFPEQRSPRHVPSEKEFWAVFEQAEPGQDQLLLLCFLHLAARKQEIFRLRREDVDLSRKQVRLRTRKRKDGSEHLDWLPMTVRLHRAMARHIAVLPGPWVFPDPFTGEPYAARQRWLSRLCRKAGVKPFGLHGIRHLSASILINAKVSLLDVQAVLRHTNLTTTQRYVHRLESVRKAIEVFE
jgi:integrase